MPLAPGLRRFKATLARPREALSSALRSCHLTLRPHPIGRLPGPATCSLCLLAPSNWGGEHAKKERSFASGAPCSCPCDCQGTLQTARLYVTAVQQEHLGAPAAQLGWIKQETRGQHHPVSPKQSQSRTLSYRGHLVACRSGRQERVACRSSQLTRRSDSGLGHVAAA